MLFDINNMHWSEQMCATFDVPLASLPTVVPSSGRCGVTQSYASTNHKTDKTDKTDINIPGSIPISGIAGDQQAVAMEGQG